MHCRKTDCKLLAIRPTYGPTKVTVYSLLGKTLPVIFHVDVNHRRLRNISGRCTFSLQAGCWTPLGDFCTPHPQSSFMSPNNPVRSTPLIRCVRYSNQNIQKTSFKHRLDSSRYYIPAPHAKDEMNEARHSLKVGQPCCTSLWCRDTSV